METSGQDIADWLVYRYKCTKSPNVLESNFKVVKCFRQAKSLLQLGLEPEMVQELIHKAVYEFGPDSFVGVRQAAFYPFLYYGTARFEEVKELELRQISKKGASIEIQIRKGKRNQTRKLQQCIIHPNSLEYKGKMCPVGLIVCYLSLCQKLGHNSDKNYLFKRFVQSMKRFCQLMTL